MIANLVVNIDVSPCFVRGVLVGRRTIAKRDIHRCDYLFAHYRDKTQPSVVKVNDVFFE